MLRDLQESIDSEGTVNGRPPDAEALPYPMRNVIQMAHATSITRRNGSVVIASGYKPLHTRQGQ